MRPIFENSPQLEHRFRFCRLIWILARHTYQCPADTYVHTYDVTCRLARHLARGIDAFLLDAPFSRRGLSSLKAGSPAESEGTIHCESLRWPPPPLLLRAFYFTALSVNCRRIGSSTGRPACCAPPGDELLLSRASRSRGLTLFGLSSRERVRPRKVQIAKNNIAVDGEGENNRIGDAAGCKRQRRRRRRRICTDLVSRKSYNGDVVPFTYLAITKNALSIVPIIFSIDYFLRTCILEGAQPSKNIANIYLPLSIPNLSMRLREM